MTEEMSFIESHAMDTRGGNDSWAVA
jgi:hypothetical protein